jgi:outer membrane protein assembly factor BamC
MYYRLPLTLLIAATLAGCASRSERPCGEEGPDLAIPPGLSMPQQRGEMAIPPAISRPAAAQAPLLPPVSGVTMQREGSYRWLRVESDVESLWPRLIDFWQQLGLTIDVNDPAVGIMETGWDRAFADSRMTLYQRVASRFDALAVRDKYRLRLDRLEEGGSEIHLTHYALEQFTVTEPEEPPVGKWRSREADPALVSDLLNRLLIHLGLPASEAEAILAGGGEEVSDRFEWREDELWISEGFNRAWRRVGIALDRLGIVVDDRDRSRGIYYVSALEGVINEARKPDTLMAALMQSKVEDLGQMRVVVLNRGNESRVDLWLAEGEESSEHARAFLSQLATQLR